MVNRQENLKYACIDRVVFETHNFWWIKKQSKMEGNSSVPKMTLKLAF